MKTTVKPCVTLHVKLENQFVDFFLLRVTPQGRRRFQAKKGKQSKSFLGIKFFLGFLWMFVKLSRRTEESNLRPVARSDAGQRLTQLHYVTHSSLNYREEDSFCSFLMLIYFCNLNIKWSCDIYF